MSEYNTFEPLQIQTQSFEPGVIVLREEQKDAVKLAKAQFGAQPRGGVYKPYDKSCQFLWNAKMRFGKTICAMQLVKEMGVRRVLIVTHRPVVNQGFHEDFEKIFGTNNPDYSYGTKSDKEGNDKGNFYDLERFVNNKDEHHYVFFASMQYLRRSTLVGGDNDEQLKKDLLNMDWDLVVVDEAHEGTRTSLGQRVIEKLRKEKTKMLHLSGTPFNLFNDFKDNEIYTWDYIQEQDAKEKWAQEHPIEYNPYAELPKMKIFTYDLGKLIKGFIEEGSTFKFSEFFRTWTGNPRADNPTGEGKDMPEGAKGRFVHEEEIIRFLDMLCDDSKDSNYPFSKSAYQENFNHTLWIVPGVKEAAALKQLLEEHDVFSAFKVVNVAGNNKEDEEKEDALDRVKEAIGEQPRDNYTITISCGRLTTGVTVPQWTAVLYMKGSDTTSAATYMQTIFRVQSPWKDTEHGDMKATCSVFDFAPDRSLRMVAETAKYSSLAKSKSAKRDKTDDDDLTQEQRDKKTLAAFLQHCSVVSLDGGSMKEFDVSKIYTSLERVMVERLVRNGFDDDCLYVMDEVNKIAPDTINDIGKHGGTAPDEGRKDATKQVDLTNMTPEERAAWEAQKAKRRKEIEEALQKRLEKERAFQEKWKRMSEVERKAYLEEQARKAEERERRKQEREEFKKRVSNIRGIALRIPLLMYGGADAGDPKEDLTVENFTRKIKDESWAEFMPKGISKKDFNDIRKCFNATRFEEAGKRYRALAREADEMHVEDRIQRITEIFSYFHNPDKETVLTPWRVVNMHMSDTVGGWCFYDETFDKKTGQILEPRFVDQGQISMHLFDNVDFSGEVQTKVLEINSKTGLYPLYVTYSLYRRRLEEYVRNECIDLESVSVTEEQVVWDDIIADNIYVICNTPMAVGITKRTLFGFRQVERKANIKNDQLVERASKDQTGLIKELMSVGYWKGNTSKQEMKFNAVIGNPPYQIMDGGAQASATPVYNLFVNVAKMISPSYISMIMPARWYGGGKGLDKFREEMINDKHIVVLHDFLNSTDCFSNVEIKGGVCYFLRDSGNEKPCSIYTHKNGLIMNSSERFLKEGDSDVFIRFNEAINIYHKIQAKSEPSFEKLVSSQKPFGLRTYVKGDDHKSPRKTVALFQNGGIGYIEEEEITKNKELINRSKVFISAAYNAGDSYPHQILGKPLLGTVGTACTETYVMIGPFANDSECENVISYIKTKFFRFLVMLKKSSQHAPASVFSFVPVQEFYKSWTDDELYAKYDLDLIEREFIESIIKPMD